MRYFLTLPLAALAIGAAPALAQDATPPTDTAPVEAATAAPPPMEPMDPTTATPPSDTTAGDDAVPPPADPLPTPEATTPATTPTGPSAPAGLTAEQQAAYDAWPAETKAYFDALTPSRQALFLRLAGADKAKLVALPADQQEAVWTSLEEQAAEQQGAAPTGN